MSLVRPGSEEVRASLPLPVRKFIKDDLPELDFPAKAISGAPKCGSLALSATDMTNSALFILISSPPRVSRLLVLF